MIKNQKEKKIMDIIILFKVYFYRLIYFLIAPFIGKISKNLGKEMFLSTSAGKIRVLGYNMDNKTKQPIYIFFHGGGFIMGNADGEDYGMMNLSQKTGIKIINVDYSLSPEVMFPVALEECYAVVKYVKDNAEKIFIDERNIAIGGNSAGGNLCAAISLLDNERKDIGIKCAILNYPGLDLYSDPYLKLKLPKSLSPKLLKLFNYAYRKDEESQNPLISPCFADIEHLKSFPVSLIITAELDSLTAEVELFTAKLEKAGVKVTYKKFIGCKHGFLHHKTREADEAWLIMNDFLKMNLINSS